MEEERKPATIKAFGTLSLNARVYQEATNLQPPLDSSDLMFPAGHPKPKEEPNQVWFSSNRDRYLVKSENQSSEKIAPNAIEYYEENYETRTPAMPPAKDYAAKNTFSRSMSASGVSMSARVYHPATNLMPPSPPLSPTGSMPSFNSKSTSFNSYSRQNSQNQGKHS